jgi:hypothetical protein
MMNFLSKLFGKTEEPTHEKLSPEEREAEINRLLNDPLLKREHGLDD